MAPRYPPTGGGGRRPGGGKSPTTRHHGAVSHPPERQICLKLPYFAAKHEAEADKLETLPSTLAPMAAASPQRRTALSRTGARTNSGQRDRRLFWNAIIMLQKNKQPDTEKTSMTNQCS